MKKLLLSMRVTEEASYKETRNSIAYEYIEFFEKLGYLVILVPNNSSLIKRYFNDKIDLVVFSGGNNVDPIQYSGDTNLDDVYTERDKIEQEMFSIAYKQCIKILAICRGFHAVNVFLGGTISQNIKGHVNKPHKIISNQTYLHNQITNSFHNQGIKDNDLYNTNEVIPIAKSEDGFIEAAINQKKNILGIQWHPERQNELFDMELIQNFINGNL